MEKFMIRVYNSHWTQIRFLMLLGYDFVEKNMHENFYIVECEEPLVTNLKSLNEKCKWIASISKHIEKKKRKNEKTTASSVNSTSYQPFFPAYPLEHTFESDEECKCKLCEKCDDNERQQSC